MTLGVDEDTSGVGDIAWIPALLYWNRGDLHASFAMTNDEIPNA
jgi:hypothetical protein